MDCKACNKGGFKCMECEGHEVKLLPCPFCGGEADFWYCDDECCGAKPRAVECKSCGCELPAPKVFSEEADCVKTWNTRVKEGE